MEKIRIFDLTRQVRNLKGEIEKGFSTVFSTGQFILGTQVSAFEDEFRSFLGCQYAIGAGSGTGALSLAYQAIGLKRGDRIITTPTTYIATVMAAALLGARPEFIDVRPENGLMELDLLRERLSNAKRQGTVHQYKAIVPVHLYGFPEDMEQLLQISGEFGIPIVEDACQAHGAWTTLQNQRAMVGTMGKIGCFSFYPTKNLGAFGDGGMVVTNDPALAERLRMLGNYGQREERHRHFIVAGNNRLDEIQAACLRAKLPRLDDYNRRRREIAAYYNEQFTNLPLVLPEESEGSYAVHHLYVIQSADRDSLRAHLARKGVETAIHYPTPIHLQPAFKDLDFHEGQFPNAERFAKRILTLPLYPELTVAEVEHVAAAVREFF